MLRFAEVTEASLTQKLNAMLTDKQYYTQAKRMSAMFRDNPMSPMDEAMHWIEYAARHKGTPYFRSAAADLPWYIYLHLDILGALLIVIYLGVKIVTCLLRTAYSVCGTVDSDKKNK